MTIIQLQAFKCCQCHRFLYVPVPYVGGIRSLEIAEAKAKKLLKQCPYCTSARMSIVTHGGCLEILAPKIEFNKRSKAKWTFKK